MGREVEVAAVGDALQLVPAPGEEELHVGRAAGVVRELALLVVAQVELVGRDAELEVPVHPLLEPVLEPLLGVGGRDEVLHLHLLELAGAEDEVLRRDLVAEGLADLGDAEGRLLARRAEHVGEVGEHALGRLGAQVGHVALVLDRAGVGLEHEVEGPGLGEVLGAAVGADPVDLVLAPALVAVLAVDQGVGEGGQVARGGPDGGRAEDGGVEADHVVALLHHGAPPGVLDVAQHVDPERAVVVGGAEAAVDLGRGEDEAAVAAEPHHLLHQVVGGGLGRLGGLCHRCRLPERILALTSLASSRPRSVSTARSSTVARRTRSTRPSSSSGRSRASQGTPRGVRKREREGLELALLGRELLPAGLGRAAGGHGVDVAVGRAHVPPARAGAVRVGGRADADVVALVPVEVVVPALVAGTAQLEISSQW